MKAVTQELGTGRIDVVDAPAPSAARGRVSVLSRASVISPGTESMLLDFGRSSMLDKIRSQPERARQVVRRIGSAGLVPTLAAVRDRLADVLAPGYCQAGDVLECGDAGSPFEPGDRVVTNGSHAQIVRVPYNLAARIPDGVSYEAAAFTPLAAIALQGLRLAAPTLGETVVVYGLGLVGQLTVQIVRANGCPCLGIDTNPERVALAEQFGARGILVDADSPARTVRALTGGRGADAVLMTLATDDDEPMRQAAAMSRQRGRIVLVGVAGLHLQRSDFYEKELTFQVSCSYGPGRYDPAYEARGEDYPFGFVRWTEQRNFQAVLQLMADASLDPLPLITHRFPVDEASQAYEILLSHGTSLGIVLTYPDADDPRVRSRVVERPDGGRAATPHGGHAAAPDRAGGPSGSGAAVVGAGNFARRTLIPAARRAGFDIRTVVSSGGLSAALERDRSGAEAAATDPAEAFADSGVHTVFVLTRHDSHADLAARALEAGKHVFVEKPLALDLEGLERVRSALSASDRLLMVGFNRRFAPLTSDMKKIVDRRTGPLSLVLTVNAGEIARDHWVHDPDRGGGRIIGEACHFIDLARFLVGTPIHGVDVRSAIDPAGRHLDDVAHLTLGFEDGSTAAIHYLASGAPGFAKERIEAFFDGKTVAIDNWRALRTWGVGRWRLPLRRRPDKGHVAELAALMEAITKGRAPPIPADEIFEVSRWSIRAAELARGTPPASPSDG